MILSNVYVFWVCMYGTYANVEGVAAAAVNTTQHT